MKNIFKHTFTSKSLKYNNRCYLKSFCPIINEMHTYHKKSAIVEYFMLKEKLSEATCE